jgi:hypothetical protein
MEASITSITSDEDARSAGVGHFANHLHQGTETKLSTFLHFFYLPQVMQVKSENKRNYLWVQVAGKSLVVSVNE